MPTIDRSKWEDEHDDVNATERNPSEGGSVLDDVYYGPYVIRNDIANGKRHKNVFCIML